MLINRRQQGFESLLVSLEAHREWAALLCAKLVRLARRRREIHPLISLISTVAPTLFEINYLIVFFFSRSGQGTIAAGGNDTPAPLAAALCPLLLERKEPNRASKQTSASPHLFAMLDRG